MAEKIIKDRAARLADLHATSFVGAARWSEDAFRTALTDPRCLLLGDDGGEAGYALGRLIADEVELLTLIVHPDNRRQGRGRRLLARFEDRSRDRGAAHAFLEVAADNMAARAMYEQAAWRIVGKRRGYYEGMDAMLMRKQLATI